MQSLIKKKIFIIVNSPLFIQQHLLPIINKLKKDNELYLLYKYDKEFKINIKNIKKISIPLTRNPSLLDFLSLIKLAFIKNLIKPDICISFTPKAGLVNTLTSSFSRKTYHYFTGQRWANFSGLKLNFYKFIDRYIIKTCDRTFCDSYSQALFIQKSLKTYKPFVIGKGSVSGVNFKKYDVPNAIARKRLEKKENLINKKIKNLLLEENSSKKTVFGFVGRLNSDKGINELLEAFKMHNKNFSNSILLLIGPNELSQKSYKKITSTKNCFHIKFLKEIHLIIPCLSCLILPSHREGFGSVLIEAAASKVPIITTDIPGPRDFIKHLYNGYLVKPKDINSLKVGLDYFANNSNNCSIFAKRAFDLCKKYYNEDYVSNLFVKELTKKLF